MSTAVIYDSRYTKIIKRYKSLAAAKGALTRAHNHGSIRVMTSFGYGRIKGDDLENLVACTMDHFINRVDYDVEVTPLMAEKDENGNRPAVKIKRSEQGGCTDPSTERYWCM